MRPKYTLHPVAILHHAYAGTDVHLQKCGAMSRDVRDALNRTVHLAVEEATANLPEHGGTDLSDMDESIVDKFLRRVVHKPTN
jgi:hypothetical protein